jgi:hypothetical protein
MMNKLLCLALFAAVAVATATSAKADPLNLGILTNYALVDLGSGTTLGQNSGPVAGNELLGNSVKAAFAGGNNGQINGTLYYDSTVTGTNTFSQLQNAPTTSLVSTSVTSQAFSYAQAASNYAASLTATQTYGNINSATTITGNGGLNVIDVSNIQNAPLTIKGNSSDTFVINVSGTFNTNQLMTLSGVSASQILFNFTGTSGTVLQTSGGDQLYGTMLAADGGGFQFSELNLNGALIDTGGNEQFVSGSKITTFSAFAGDGSSQSVPEPSSLLSFAAGLLGLASLARRRFTAKR